MDAGSRVSTFTISSSLSSSITLTPLLGAWSLVSTFWNESSSSSSSDWKVVCALGVGLAGRVFLTGGGGAARCGRDLLAGGAGAGESPGAAATAAAIDL